MKNVLTCSVDYGKTEKQLKTSSVMVKNFKEMYKQVGYPKTLSYSLDRKLDKTYYKVAKQRPLK